MEKTKTPLSINIFYWTTKIILGLLSLVLVGILVFNVLLYTNFFDDNMQLHTSLPVKVNFSEKGNLNLHQDITKVELVEAVARIHYFDTPSYLSKRFGIAMILAFGFIMFLAITFYQFIRNVKRETIFDLQNIKLLKKMSYILVGLWLYTIIYSRIVYYYIAKNLEFEQLTITEDLPNYIGILFAALFLWVLAHIFMTGTRLQQETNLTI